MISRPVCPRCNSDAPAMDTCNVCHGYHTAIQGMPSTKLKKEWMDRAIHIRDNKECYMCKCVTPKGDEWKQLLTQDRVVCSEECKVNYCNGADLT